MWGRGGREGCFQDLWSLPYRTNIVLGADLPSGLSDLTPEQSIFSFPSAVASDKSSPCYNLCP